MQLGTSSGGGEKPTSTSGIPCGGHHPELSGTERVPAPSPYPKMHTAVITSLFGVPARSRVLQKCLLRGQRTPAEARKLLSDSRQLAEVHSLQTWEARIEKKHALPDLCKPCPGVFWPVTLGPNCSYISHVEHIFLVSLCCSGKSKPFEGGLAREWLLHSQGGEAKASAIAWDGRQ